MDLRPFAGTTALVTGGARRLGRVVCLRLATLGARVVVHHHESSVEAYQLTSELQAKGVEAVAVAADLGDPQQAAQLVERARKAAGAPLDFLVNNAASFPRERLGDLTWESLSEVLRLDAWAPFELTRAFARQARQGGAVVNLIDTRVSDYDWDHAGYILAKRMLADLTQFCAVEFAPGIRVNGVSPGPILPPAGEAEAMLDRMARHLPLRRTPSPDDVADAILYLLGARGVTGQVLAVDGGRHLGKAVYEPEADSSPRPGHASPPRPPAPAAAPAPEPAVAAKPARVPARSPARAPAQPPGARRPASPVRKGMGSARSNPRRAHAAR